MRELLSSLDIDDGLLDSILKDGHNFAQTELDISTVKAITANARPELKKRYTKKYTLKVTWHKMYMYLRVQYLHKF